MDVTLFLICLIFRDTGPKELGKAERAREAYAHQCTQEVTTVTTSPVLDIRLFQNHKEFTIRISLMRCIRAVITLLLLASGGEITSCCDVGEVWLEVWSRKVKRAL